MIGGRDSGEGGDEEREGLRLGGGRVEREEMRRGRGYDWGEGEWRGRRQWGRARKEREQRCM